MGLKIGLQDNGDDNLILGLCVDRVSLYEKVKIQLGVDKRRERERGRDWKCSQIRFYGAIFHYVIE